jgi:hypothetical protein
MTLEPGEIIALEFPLVAFDETPAMFEAGVSRMKTSEAIRYLAYLDEDSGQHIRPALPSE